MIDGLRWLVFSDGSMLSEWRVFCPPPPVERIAIWAAVDWAGVAGCAAMVCFLVLVFLMSRGTPGGSEGGAA